MVNRKTGPKDKKEEEKRAVGAMELDGRIVKLLLLALLALVARQSCPWSVSALTGGFIACAVALQLERAGPRLGGRRCFC